MNAGSNTLDIIIVNYNSTDYLLKCLESINDSLEDLSANIFVQDNSANDDIDRIINRFPKVTFTKNKYNIGFSKAVNQALKLSSAPYIVLLNPDSYVKKGFFNSCLAFMEDHSDVGIVGPKILNSDGSLQGSARSFPTPFTALFGRSTFLTKYFPNNPLTAKNILTTKYDHSKQIEVDWVSGACMVVRRSALEEVGFLDTRFFIYWEDADWCKRMTEKGWKVVYYPHASIVHFVGASSGQIYKRSIIEFHKSSFLLFDKYTKSLFWLLLKPFVIAGLFLRSCIQIGFKEFSVRYNKTRQDIQIIKDAVVNTEREKIKVMRFISRLNIGGPAIHVHILTQGLDEETFESTLVAGQISSMEGDMSYLTDSHSKKPIIIPDLQREIHIWKDVSSIIKILKLIHKEKPDIVHTHTAKAGFCARAAVVFHNFLSNYRVNTVHTFHGHVFDGYFNKPVSQAFICIERLLSKNTDVIIAISSTQQDELSNKYHIAPAYKIKTTQLGFQLKSFLESKQLKGQFKHSLGVDDKTYLIGIVGRLVQIKNHMMFFDAAKIFLKQNPDTQVKFIVVGDGELRDQLKAYCRRLGISDHVHFCGWVKDVHSVYADLDVLALTSNNEGTPVSVIEAMASSVPVIATDAGGIKDLLGSPDGVLNSDGFKTCERGILCRKNDAFGFAKGLRYLVESSGMENGRRITKARNFITKNYYHERLLKDMESLYLNLMYETNDNLSPESSMKIDENLYNT